MDCTSSDVVSEKTTSDMSKYSLAAICTKTEELIPHHNGKNITHNNGITFDDDPWEAFYSLRKSVDDVAPATSVNRVDDVPQDESCCVRCGKSDSLIVQNTYHVCTCCGWTALEPESYQLPYTENTYSPQVLLPQYDKAAKCRAQIKLLAIRSIDSVFKNRNDIDRIIANLPNPDEPTIPEIECSMKTCGIKLIEYSHLIFQKQRGLGPNIFSSQEIIAFDHMLNIVAEKFEQARDEVAPKRQNFLGKKFLVYKIMEYLGRQDILPQLQTFKVHLNNKPQEQIWDKIAELADWCI